MSFSSFLKGAYDVVAPLVQPVLSFFGVRQTNKTNQNIANQNLQAQQTENEITRQREDTAYSRAAADLQRAGLSKTLAAGSPASSASLTAPRNDYVQKSSGLEKLDFVSSLMNIKNIQSQINLNNTNALKNQAESEYYFDLGKHQNMVNETFAENFQNEQNIKKGNLSLIQSQMEYNKAKTRTENVLGSKQADYMEAQIAKFISDVNLSDSRVRYNDALILKTSQDIVESIARTSKITAEEKLVLQDLCLAMIKENVDKYNLAISYFTGSKTTEGSPYMLNVPIGNIANIIDDKTRNMVGQSYLNNLAFNFKY